MHEDDPVIPPDALEPSAALRRIHELLRHDAKNPLYALTLSSRILQSGDPSTLTEGSQLSKNALARVQSMMLQLRLFSGFATRGVRPDRSWIDVAGAVGRAQRALSHLTSDTTLAVHIPSELRVLADPEHLRLTLQTALHNAATHGEGEVRFSASSEDGLVQLRISHAGALRHAPRALFDPGQSCGRADTQAGLGLGLALSALAMQAHGGYLHITADTGRVHTIVAIPGASPR